MKSDKDWKSEQRDWLVHRMMCLRDKWLDESTSTEQVFCSDEDAEHVAKGRTGGCARELDALLKELL